MKIVQAVALVGPRKSNVTSGNQRANAAKDLNVAVKATCSSTDSSTKTAVQSDMHGGSHPLDLLRQNLNPSLYLNLKFKLGKQLLFLSDPRPVQARN